MNLEGKQNRGSQFIKHEHGNLLKDTEFIRERWIGCFRNLLNIKSPKLDPNIAEDLDQGPENSTLGVQPVMEELTCHLLFG